MHINICIMCVERERGTQIIRDMDRDGDREKDKDRDRDERGSRD